MTVSSTIARQTYNGDASTVTFAIPFTFIASADVKVVLTDASDVDTTWTEGTQYDIVGTDVVVKTTPTDYTPASGTKLTVLLNMTFQQNTDYVENDAFPAAVHESGLDKIVMMIKQLNEVVDRTIQLNDGSAFSGLKIPELVANNYLGVNSAATALEWLASLDGSNITVSTFMQTVLDDSDAETAAGTLSVETAQRTKPEATTFNFASDANYTLTAAQELFGRVIITDTGTVLTAGRDVIVSTTERAYYIQNDTAQILTVKTSGGTGIAVATTEKILIACDGTDVIRLLNIIVPQPTQATQAAIEAETNEDTYIPPDLLKHGAGVAKHRVSFDGTNASPDGTKTGFNVGTIVDNGTGSYTVPFSTNMSAATYTVASNMSGAATDVNPAWEVAAVDKAVGSYRVDGENASSVQQDIALVDVIVLGDF